MNSKGTFTSMLGAMALFLVISSTFIVINDVEATDNSQIIREAGDLKRTIAKSRFYIDELTTIAMFKAVQDDGRCDASTVQTYNSYVDTAVQAFEPAIKNTTGVDCDIEPITGAGDNIAGG